jgi:hypothetical protein
MIRNALVCAALFLIPAAFASADTGNIARDAGPFEFTLNGTGSNSHNFSNGSGSIGGSFGWFATPNIELSVRDNASYVDTGNGSSWANNVRVAADLHLNFDRIQPFIGGNVGYVSGPNTHTPEAAPEGGVKIFLTNQAFLYGMVEYNFFWHTSGNDVSSTANHGQFLYGVGLGLRF